MPNNPQIWHYGLMAEIWAEFLTNTPELDFYRQQIKHFGQPVLDLACGTGRLLLPLLQAGIDIDGCDVSADMLKLCREKAAQKGLTPHLYEQAMHQFDAPRRYKIIYICDAFGLVANRHQNLDTLACCFRHLDQDGALILNIEAEYNLPDAWQFWLKETRQRLPEPWPEQGKKRTAANGVDYVSRFRLLEIDPLEQSYVRQVRLEKWQNGKLLVREEYTLRGFMFFRNEVEWMLNVAGFGHVTVLGDYSDKAATPNHNNLVFIAGK